MDKMHVHNSLSEGDDTVLISGIGGRGIPYKAITAIEPLGRHEKRFLQGLQKNI